MAVQGPPLRVLLVSLCVHEGRRRRPYPVTGGGCQDPQLPRRLAYPSPIQRAVGRSQGLGAPVPQPVGASGQLGKEQALPCAENLFSRCGVRLGEYDGTPHRGTCPSSAELPEFLQRQECGTTETVSEAPRHIPLRKDLLSQGLGPIWHPREEQISNTLRIFKTLTRCMPVLLWVLCHQTLGLRNLDFRNQVKDSLNFIHASIPQGSCLLCYESMYICLSSTSSFVNSMLW